MSSTTTKKIPIFLEETPEYKKDTQEFLAWEKQRREASSYITRRAQFEKRKGYYAQFIDKPQEGK